MKTLTKFITGIVGLGFLMAAGYASAASVMFHIVGSSTSDNTYSARLLTGRVFTVESTGSDSYKVSSTGVATGSVVFNIYLNGNHPGMCYGITPIQLVVDDSKNIITVADSGVYSLPPFASSCPKTPQAVLSGDPATGYTLTLKY